MPIGIRAFSLSLENSATDHSDGSTLTVIDRRCTINVPGSMRYQSTCAFLLLRKRLFSLPRTHNFQIVMHAAKLTPGQFEDPCGAHASPDAHRYHPVPHLPPLHLRQN